MKIQLGLSKRSAKEGDQELPATAWFLQINPVHQLLKSINVLFVKCFELINCFQELETVPAKSREVLISVKYLQNCAKHLRLGGQTFQTFAQPIENIGGSCSSHILAPRSNFDPGHRHLVIFLFLLLINIWSQWSIPLHLLLLLMMFGCSHQSDDRLVLTVQTTWLFTTTAPHTITEQVLFNIITIIIRFMWRVNQNVFDTLPMKWIALY